MPRRVGQTPAASRSEHLGLRALTLSCNAAYLKHLLASCTQALGRGLGVGRIHHPTNAVVEGAFHFVLVNALGQLGFFSRKARTRSLNLRGRS
jgi:hypothetical protein